MDEAKLHALVGAFLTDLGGAFSVPLVQIGEKLGLYKKLNEIGPCSAAELANARGLAERYVREWLCAQAASNYVTYDAETDEFSMSPEQAFVLADESSPLYLAPAFNSAAVFQQNEAKVSKAFETGEGVPWGDQSECLSCAVARFFRPGYENNLIQVWLPKLAGVVERLEAGAKVLDVGCGHGITTSIIAKSFPKSEVLGVDFHESSIEAARQHAFQQGLTNVRFDTSVAKDVSGEFDLAMLFDCLHDMGDPAGAMQHIRGALKEDASCMIVEPMAGDSLAENLNPVSRLYYNASTMVCVPTSLAQEKGVALGAQAGERRLREIVVGEAGFRSLERVDETPFNLILEAKP